MHRTYPLVAAALIAASPLSAQSVAGKWNAAMNTPGGMVPLALDLKVSGDTVTGTVDDNGPIPLMGMVQHDTLSFSYTVNYNGHPLLLTMTARIAGDSLKGLVDFNGEGTGEFWASRPAPAVAEDGMTVLKRMHDAYAGKWFPTLTFTQRTIVTRSGTTDTTLWYESLKGPRLLRIDMGDPAAGNGVLYTVDSTIVVRNGAVTRRAGDGNEALPFVMGIYLQPIDSSARQLASFGFDLHRTVRSGFNGMPVIIVGTADPSDSTSPQFWVDPARLITLRIRGAFGGQPPIDIAMGGYRQVGGGWLATHFEFRLPGFHQVEQYFDWNINRVLPDALFDPAQWTTAANWARAAARAH
jgi:hypothetical protein